MPSGQPSLSRLPPPAHFQGKSLMAHKAHRPNFIPQCQGELGSSGELSQRSPAFSAHARHCAGRGRISSEGPRGVSMSWRQ